MISLTRMVAGSWIRQPSRCLQRGLTLSREAHRGLVIPSTVSPHRVSARGSDTGIAALLQQPRALRRTSARTFASTAVPRQEGAEQERELDDGEKNIVDILRREFQPETLQVQDVSGGCGSFYAIVIASHKFKGLSTIKAHRLVNDALKDVIAGIHGLQLRTMPADDAKMG